MFGETGIGGHPFLIRSDRGGGDGRSSRCLAEAWLCCFLACFAHLLSNTIEEYENTLEKAGHNIVTLHSAIRKAFYDPETNGREKRWVEWQKAATCAVDVEALQTVVEGLEAEVLNLCDDEVAGAVRETLVVVHGSWDGSPLTMLFR